MFKTGIEGNHRITHKTIIDYQCLVSLKTMDIWINPVNYRLIENLLDALLCETSKNGYCSQRVNGKLSLSLNDPYSN